MRQGDRPADDPDGHESGGAGQQHVQPMAALAWVAISSDHAGKSRLRRTEAPPSQATSTE